MRPPVGSTLGRYHLDAEIGRGGVGTVYRARHCGLDTWHALKIVDVHDPRARLRALREAQVQATLRHENIVRATDSFETDDYIAIVCDLVEGPSLRSRMDAGRLPLGSAHAVVTAVLRGMAQVHRQDLVHRDLKPGNVLLEPDLGPPTARVTDFGLARGTRIHDRHTLTDPFEAVGTPAFMAPEQLAGAKADKPTIDVFALGCLMFELYTGGAPFDRQVGVGGLNARRAEQYYAPEPLEPMLPTRLCAAIRGSLRGVSSARIPSAVTLLGVIDGRIDPAPWVRGAAEGRHGREPIAVGPRPPAESTQAMLRWPSTS